MLRLAPAALFAPGLLLATAAALVPAPRGDDAPPLRLVLTLDGVEHALDDGRPRELTVGDRKVTASVRVEPTRVFRAAGITFEFPREFGYAVDKSEGIVIYTLDGPSVVLMLHVFDDVDAEETAASILGSVLEAMDATAKPQPAKLQLGERSVDALRARSELSGELGMTWVVGHLEAGGKKVIVYLQDLPEDAVAVSPEMERVRELLAKTFRVE